MKKLLPFFLLATLLNAHAWKTAGGFSMDFAHVTIETTQLADHTYLLHGSGGNMVVSVGPDGILLVDSEFPPMAAKIMAAIAKIQPGPVRFLVDTHWHIDHSGCNSAFMKTGTTVIAQDNVRERLLGMKNDWYFGQPIPEVARAGAPTLTYSKEMTIHMNGEDVLLFHDVPAHTDGDTVVYFPKANVIHLGDVYINGLYPIIDLGSQGTIQGYFPVLDHALALINDQTKVIPGHGPVASKKDLQFYRDMLLTIRDRVQAMISQGKTLNEIIAANPSKEFDHDWASDRVGPAAVTKMIYQSLVPTQPPLSPWLEAKSAGK
jgi:cyclase